MTKTQEEPEADSTVDQPSGVFISKVEENGNVRAVVSTVGDVQITEVQTLIELGLSYWRQALGLPKL